MIGILYYLWCDIWYAATPTITFLWIQLNYLFKWGIGLWLQIFLCFFFQIWQKKWWIVAFKPNTHQRTSFMRFSLMSVSSKYLAHGLLVFPVTHFSIIYGITFSTFPGTKLVWIFNFLDLVDILKLLALHFWKRNIHFMLW